ncbi:MAG: GxxExxY protein [Myxococcota bacterium]|jgi:GxxExxY protein|nr:GxxExxY protein [Myxococcota bacterium]
MQQEDRKGGRREEFVGDGSREVIAACIDVHRLLGPGLLESAYRTCLARELSIRGLQFERERPVRVTYKGVEAEAAYRIDFVVLDRLLIEVKSVERLLPVHHAQVFTYLKLTGLPTALLVNFNATTLREGLRRLTQKK